ncbi:hypothetical protein [Alkaliphilus hydrothermalis]|uniref:Transposase n=1 Tax=Alkaliphilus hydrothermalis TaxID=1482730 RepID=A0ABS2NTS9_9FIRM|nr:hypothetical protein [Alkaliphilus hydrothermalis]MBM7616348.1 hypothetical protein [Alkaliphilus hydrothermalis]
MYSIIGVVSQLRVIQQMNQRRQVRLDKGLVITGLVVLYNIQHLPSMQ